MKHSIFTFLSVLTLLLCTISSSAQTIVLSEGFENGIPAEWTQENLVENQLWTVESGGQYPAGSYEGTHRAVLRNPTDQTIGFKTRLITPVMDLLGVFQPILIFAHAQAAWTGDFDTLRVWYRSDSRADWKILTEYTSAISGWKVEKLDLVGVSGSYQLAFEGTDNLGRGIVLDDIQVRSKPECTVPNNMYITNMAEGAVTLGWHASLDANYFQIVLTTEEVDIDTLSRIPDDKIAFNENMEADSVTYRLKNLVAGQHYWAYVRSLCDDENSEWGMFAFRMNATKQIPYFEDFNENYTAGHASQPLIWTFGNNLDTEVPFIPTHMAPSTTAFVPYSPDGTYSLAFTGKGADLTSAIPSGYYAYAATPELVGAAIKDCQVRFWTTVATYTGRQNACSIIVGVMSNPDDIRTFVPMDTVSVYGNMSFRENVVSLASYTGTGRYVAFMSNFNLPNRIYVDNLTVEQRPALGKVLDVYVDPRDNEATFSWSPAVGATGYDVMVTTEEVDPATTVAGSNVIKKETVTGTSYTITGLPVSMGITTGINWSRPYYVYVRAINASEQSEWSYRTPFIVTPTGTVPMAFDFDDVSTGYKLNNIGNVFYPTEVTIFSNHGDAITPYPCYSNKVAHLASPYSIYTNIVNGEDAWMVLPRITNRPINALQIKFFITGGTSPQNVHVGLGVMTNPMDLNTYSQIADFTCETNDFVRCMATFADYTGQGEYIAIRWLDSRGDHSEAYIDDITVDMIDECLVPTGLSANVDEDKAAIDWSAGGAQHWQVLLTNEYWNDDRLDAFDPMASYPSVVKVANITNIPHIEVEGLTPSVKYYCYVRTECNTSYSEWSSAFSFTTSCTPVQKTPYLETFTRYGTGKATFPTCWTSDFSFGYSPARDYYPYIRNTNDFDADGGGSLYLYEHINSTTGEEEYSSAAVAPLLDIPVTETRVEFYMYTSSADYPVAVGVMSDPNDFTTFEPIKVFRTSTPGKWKKLICDLSSYTGTGKYICFTNKGIGAKTTGEVFIDHVTFSTAICAAPYDIHAVDADDKSMSLAWEGTTTTDWQVILSTTKGIIEGSNLTGISKVKDTVVVENQVYIDGLTLSTAYYVYIRPTCGNKEWSVEEVSTECMHINPRVTYHETFDTYTAGTSVYPYCWTCKNGKTTSATYVPYVIKPTSATVVASMPNSLYLYGTTTYYPAWAAAPKVDTEDLSQLIVSFTTSYTSTSNHGLFGVMTDPEDISTFVAVDSFQLTTTPELHLYDMSEYKDVIGDAKYIAWSTPQGKNSRFYVDDVTISLSTCPTPKPSVSKVTHNSARVESGLRVSNPWRIILTNKPLDAEKLEAGDYSIPAGTKLVLDTVLDSRRLYCILNNLQEETDYYVAVASVCDTITSMWFNLSFTTTCHPVTMEELGTIGFEDIEGYVASSSLTKKVLPCWIVGNDVSNNADYIPYVDNSDGMAHTGNNALYIYTTSTNNGAYAIMPAIEAADISHLQLNFYARSKTNSPATQKLSIGIMTDPSDLGTLTPVGEVSVTDEYSGYSLLLRDYMGDYMGNKGKYICFRSQYSSSNQIYLDDISLEVTPSCPMPQNVKMQLINENTAGISWTGYSNKYRVVLSTDEVAASDMETCTKFVVDTIVANATSMTLSGLLPGTQYFVYVQGICSDTDRSAFSTARVWVKTDCAPRAAMPYLCDFDHNTANGLGVMPDCWAGAYLGSPLSNYPAVIGVAHRGNKGYGLQLYSVGTSRTMAVMPDLMADDLSRYVISFHARTAAAGKSLLVGYVSDVNDMERTFHVIDTVEVGKTFHKFYVDLAPFKEELIGMRLAFMVNLLDSVDVNNIYIDNVAVGPAPTCLTAEVSSVEATLTEATVSIYATDPTQTQWQAALVEESKFTGEDNILRDGVVQTTTEKTVTFTGLQSGTKYLAFVRAVCSETDMSDWSDEAYPFFTLRTYSDTYFFGFERSEGWMRAADAETDDLYLHPALKAGATNSTDYQYYGVAVENDEVGTYARTDNGALRLVTESGDNTGAYVIFPSIENAKARSFSFDVRPGYADVNNVGMSKVYPKTKLYVGSVEKGKGMETYQNIVTIQLPAHTTKDKVTEANDYLFQTYTFNFDVSLMRKRQLVLMNSLAAETFITIDNVRLDATKTFTTPVPVSTFVADTYVDLVFVSDDRKTVYFIPSTVKPDNTGNYNLSDSRIKQVSNVYDEIHITGLEPSTDYTMHIVANGAPQGANELSTYTAPLTTQCTPKAWTDGKLVYDFEEDLERAGTEYSSSDYFYMKPACWYRPAGAGWLVNKTGFFVDFPPKQTTNQLVYGMGGSQALYYYSGTKPVEPAYICMPLLDCDFDTTEINFYARTLIEDATTHKISTKSKATITSGHLIVGTCTDQQDISTFEALDTLLYDRGATKSTLLNEDPQGLDYWQKFTLPLKGAKGRYITFMIDEANFMTIDNITFQKISTMVPPKGLYVTPGATTATAQWTKEWQPTLKTVVYLYKEDKTSLVKCDTVAPGTMQYEFTNLRPGTGYAACVAQIDGKKTSPKSTFVTFYTNCENIGINYSTSFEEGIRPLPTNLMTPLYTVPCWTFVNAGSETSVTDDYPNVKVSSASNQYGHTGSNAVSLSAKTVSSKVTFNDYMVSPMFENVDLDTVQIEFWAIPASRNSMDEISSTTYLGATYAKSVEIGTCIDPYDMTTFSPLQICTYHKAITTGTRCTAENDYMYERFIVPLEGAVGPYVYIRACQKAEDGTEKNNSRMFIDDVSFSHYTGCPVPEDVRQTAATTTSITLSWTTPGDKFVVETYIEGNATEPVKTEVVDDALAVHQHTITGLKPKQTYYVQLKTVCDATAESRWSTRVKVFTYVAPYWMEDFRGTEMKDAWTTSSSAAGNIFAGLGKGLTGSNNTTYGWRRITDDRGGIKGAHYGTPFYTSSTTTAYNHYWLITPSITLDDVTPAHLTFRMAMTSFSDPASESISIGLGPRPIGGSSDQSKDEPFTGKFLPDQAFMVIVSEDDGQTWHRENAVVWAENATADHLLSSIPYEGEQYVIDLSRYMGKNIKIAFYKESGTYAETVPFIHIAEVRVNYYVRYLSNQTRCQYEDAEAYGLFINGMVAKEGINEASRYRLAAENEQVITQTNDTVYTLRADYLKTPESNMSATFCLGSNFTEYGFSHITREGVYRRKLTSAVTGCDSIVTLHLDGIPVILITEEDNVCRGETYTWRGQTLTRSGIYGDTLKSLVTGCDSIHQLILTYFDDEDILTKEVTIEEKDLPYNFESISYPVGTLPGVYVDTITIQGTTCKATMIHTLTIKATSDLEEVTREQLDRMMNDGEAHKFLYQDRLYILRDAQWYDAQGRKIIAPKRWSRE